MIDDGSVAACRASLVVQVDPWRELDGKKVWLLALQIKNFRTVCDPCYIKLKETNSN